MIAATSILNRSRAIVALGGGGARGLAHFGALQALREKDFCIERIVGTSIGSLAGAMFATEPNLRKSICRVVDYVTSEEFGVKQASLCGAHPKTELATDSGMLAWYDRIKSFLWARRLLTRVFTRRSLLSGKVLEDVIAALVPDIDICETQVPLSVVAVDLKSGHQVVLEQGSLRKAILASAAIPGIFPPVAWQEMLLCDFGVLESIPTEVAASYDSETLIAVDVGPSIQHASHCDSALHVLLRMDEIGERLYRRHSLRLADVLIRPEVGPLQWFDFSNPQALIQAGLDAGHVALSAWQQRLEPHYDSRDSIRGEFIPAKRLE